MTTKYIDPMIKNLQVNDILRLIERGRLVVNGQGMYHSCIEAMLMRVQITGILKEDIKGCYHPTTNTNTALAAIIAYAYDMFPLPETMINSELAGKRYSELPNMYKNYFESNINRFMVISHDTPEDQIAGINAVMSASNIM